MSETKPPHKSPPQTHTPLFYYGFRLPLEGGKQDLGKSSLNLSFLPHQTERVNLTLEEWMQRFTEPWSYSSTSRNSAGNLSRLVSFSSVSFPQSQDKGSIPQHDIVHTMWFHPLLTCPQGFLLRFLWIFISRALELHMVATCGPLAFETQRVRITIGCKYKTLDSEDAGWKKM